MSIPGSPPPADDDPYRDHYPMVPSHPGWGERPASTVRWQRALVVVFAVLSVSAVFAIAWWATR